MLEQTLQILLLSTQRSDFLFVHQHFIPHFLIKTHFSLRSLQLTQNGAEKLLKTI